MTSEPLIRDRDPGDDSATLVEVAFARTRPEADLLHRRLSDASIMCGIECTSLPSSRGIAVLADAAQLVRATELLSLDARMYDDDEEEEDEGIDDDEDDDLDDDEDDDYPDDDGEFSDDEDDFGDDDDEDDEDFEDDDDF